MNPKFTAASKERRRFMHLGLQTLCGAGLAFGNHPMQTLANAAEPGFTPHSDYRALVCIYLNGGIDGFSLMVPTGNAEYAEYQHSRQGLAVPHGSLLDMYPRRSDTTSLGWHPDAAPLASLFEQEQLGVVANVGTLIEPTSQSAYEDQAVRLPTQLFSHADQEVQWQQLQGQTTANSGWGALAADILSSHQSRDYLTSITLAGSNYWQSGSGQRPFGMRASGLVQYSGMSNGSQWERPRREGFQRLLQEQYSHLFADAYADLQHRAGNVTAELGAALEAQPELSTAVPSENALAEKLGRVAHLIAAHEQLQMKRQIFYVSMDGFDVHDAQNRDTPWLFAQLSQAMAFFNNAMLELGMHDKVTTFTASDFGRSLTSNGDGTDHGWGNHHLVMGGAVDGGSITGQVPRMSVDGPDAVRNGRVIPTLAASQYAGSLLQWMGLDDATLSQVLPDLDNFATRTLPVMRS